jgi:hypothetical protein
LGRVSALMVATGITPTRLRSEFNRNFSAARKQ